MFRLRSLAVVVLLVALSLMTLKLMGLSQWIQAILVIGVELLLGVILHEMVERKDRQEHEPRHRLARRPAPGVARRKPSHSASHRDRIENTRFEVLPSTAYQPTCRLLLPIRGDQPSLVEFAIRESRAHRAELDLLFVRRLTISPMGPACLPTEDDDEDAHKIIERIRNRSEREGVPFRSHYVVTAHPALTILELAKDRESDLVVMSVPRSGGFIAKRIAQGDLNAVLKSLPEHIGLLVHA